MGSDGISEETTTTGGAGDVLSASAGFAPTPAIRLSGVPCPLGYAAPAYPPGAEAEWIPLPLAAGLLIEVEDCASLPDDLSPPW